jgi:hypothetical protein
MAKLRRQQSSSQEVPTAPHDVPYKNVSTEKGCAVRTVKSIQNEYSTDTDTVQ